jgi:sec-independent protein translocase protein TatA
MDFFGGHLPELIVVLVVILIIWGPGKLPEIGGAVGRGIREFRKALSETRDAVRNSTATPEAHPDPPAGSTDHTTPTGPDPGSRD